MWSVSSKCIEQLESIKMKIQLVDIVIILLADFISKENMKYFQKVW